MTRPKARTLSLLPIACLLALLPSVGLATEQREQTEAISAINMALPIHQQKKLHPELSDPVLGDQAQIVEWAWSPQYAKRFNLPMQPDGLEDGALWLIGVKVARIQSENYQRYRCNIVGLLDNKLPILTPPGEIYVLTPGYAWYGGMPGIAMADTITNFTPGQAAWIRKPKNEREKRFPEWSLTLSYLAYYQHFQPDLAFFEIEGACGYFQDPTTHRNEIGFPRLVEGKSHADRRRSAYLKPSAIKFDIPDSLMRKMYPYLRDAHDWGSCFMRREGNKNGGRSFLLTTHALVTKRFGTMCEPATKTQNRY